MKTALSRLAAVLIGVLVLLEELAWGLLDALRRAVETVVPFDTLRAWLRRRSRWQALGLFSVLLALAEGGKVAALALIGTGKLLLGLAVLVLLKMIGGVILVTLWQECRDRLLEFALIARAHRIILAWKARVHAWLDRQTWWQSVRGTLRSLKDRVRGWLGVWRRAG